MRQGGGAGAGDGPLSPPAVRAQLREGVFWFVHIQEAMNLLHCEVGRLLHKEWGHWAKVKTDPSRAIVVKRECVTKFFGFFFGMYG